MEERRKWAHLHDKASPIAAAAAAAAAQSPHPTTTPRLIFTVQRTVYRIKSISLNVSHCFMTTLMMRHFHLFLLTWWTFWYSWILKMILRRWYFQHMRPDIGPTRHLFSRLLSHTKFISSSMQMTRNSTWLSRLAVTHVIFLHFSLVWTVDLHIWFCENGMTRNASIALVILFCTSQTLKSLSSLKSVNVAGTAIPVFDKVKILGAALNGPSHQNYPIPVFVTSDHLNRFIHP